MMTPSPRVWLATFLGLVFTIGLCAGVVVERVWLHEASRPGRPPMGERGGGPGPGPGRGGPMGGPLGPSSEQIVAEIGREFPVSAEQRERIVQILDRRQARLRELQMESRRVFTEEQQALQDEIGAVLTPEQKAAFKKMMDGRLGSPGGRGRGRDF